MIAHHFGRFLELHGQSAALGRPRRLEPRQRQSIGLDLPRAAGKGPGARRPLGPQRHLAHQSLGKGPDHRDQPPLIPRQRADVLIQLPKRALQGERGIVGQHLFNLANLHRRRRQMRGEQKGRRIGKSIKHRQSLRRQKLGKL